MEEEEYKQDEKGSYMKNKEPYIAATFSCWSITADPPPSEPPRSIAFFSRLYCSNAMYRF